MGIIEKLFKLTPFYNLYRQYKRQQTNKAQEKLEAKIFESRVRFYKGLIQSNDLVFDVGANIGNRVNALLECKAKIVAIEPQPNCVKMLNKRFLNRITIENVGLSSEKGELEMQIADDTTISTFSQQFISKTKERFKYSKWEQTIIVPVTTMEALIEKYGVPQFCKIDVEGFELQVLKGLKTPIPFISLEYCVPEMQEELVECLDYINNMSPEAFYNYSAGESMLWGFDEWVNYNKFMCFIQSEQFINTYFGDIYIKSNK